jgi:RNA 3'-terminal phosphate cyclase (ATP)
MARHASSRLAALNISAEVTEVRVQAACSGAALFLLVEHESGLAGFTALGRRGKPAEEVAEEAVRGLVRYLRTEAALDEHLGD